MNIIIIKAYYPPPPSHFFQLGHLRSRSAPGHLHFIISNVVIPTGLKILREEQLNHLKYRENSVAFVLLLCQLQFKNFPHGLDPNLISFKCILCKYGERLYLPLVELRRLLHIIFESLFTACRLDEAHLKSSGSIQNRS